MGNKTLIDDALYEYLCQVSLREPDVLTKLRNETADMPRAGMQISPDQGQLMALLVKLMGARRTLEIGVFTGYSSTAVALALPEGGQVVACDVSEEFTSIARRYWDEAGISHKVDLRLGPAIETLDALIAEGQVGAFDFAFIDADKSNYMGYYERCLRLVRAGGLIAIDNVLWGGRVIELTDIEEDTVTIRRLNEALLADERVDLCMLPISDGLTLARIKG